jgi:ABC-type transporter Mla subunit MlaD
MPRTVLTRLVVVASLALSLAACGGDDGGSAQDQPTDVASSPAEAGPVPVEAYLEGLCVAVGDYQDDVTTLSDDLQTQLDSVESTDDVKDLLVSFLDEAVASTQGLAEEVRALGVPDVDRGEEIATTFVNAFEQVEDLFATSKAEVEAMSTDDPVALAEGFEEVATNLETGGEEIASVFDSLPESDLDVDPEDIPACAAIAS